MKAKPKPGGRKPKKCEISLVVKNDEKPRTDTKKPKKTIKK